jgi:hypothetical protein
LKQVVSVQLKFHCMNQRKFNWLLCALLRGDGFVASVYFVQTYLGSDGDSQTVCYEQRRRVRDCKGGDAGAGSHPGGWERKRSGPLESPTPGRNLPE